MLSNSLLKRFITTGERLGSLRKRLAQPGIIRAMEAHSGLSALIIDKASATRKGQDRRFDAMWSSSLTSSTLKGKPDIEVVDITQRMSIVDDCMESCRLPVIYDGDTGGSAEIFHFTVRTLEQRGVSAAVIEDKSGLKQNSLFGTERKQQLEDIETFCEKLQRGKAAQVGDEFMIFARIEALIAGYGLHEALKRANAYVTKGKADGILIHSKEKKPDEIFAFCKEFRKSHPSVPIIVVPTTYNSVTEEELEAAGINICIYANHLLRAAFPVMVDACENILQNGRSKELDGSIMGIKDILNLIPDGAAK